MAQVIHTAETNVALDIVVFNDNGDIYAKKWIYGKNENFWCPYFDKRAFDTFGDALEYIESFQRQNQAQSPEFWEED